MAAPWQIRMMAGLLSEQGNNW